VLMMVMMLRVIAPAVIGDVRATARTLSGLAENH